MEGLEVLLSAIEQFGKRRAERVAAAAQPPAPVPSPPPPPPSVVAERARAASAARAAAAAASAGPAQSRVEPLVPFTSGARDVIRAVIASEVLAPPLALREDV